MHMYSIFTVGHNTQYYTDKPQWAEKNWEMKVVALINFINIFKGEITNSKMKLKNKIKIMPLIIVIFLQITLTIK